MVQERLGWSEQQCSSAGYYVRVNVVTSQGEHVIYWSPYPDWETHNDSLHLSLYSPSSSCLTQYLTLFLHFTIQIIYAHHPLISFISYILLFFLLLANFFISLPLSRSVFSAPFMSSSPSPSCLNPSPKWSTADLLAMTSFAVDATPVFYLRSSLSFFSLQWLDLITVDRGARGEADRWGSSTAE